MKKLKDISVNWWSVLVGTWNWKSGCTELHGGMEFGAERLENPGFLVVIYEKRQPRYKEVICDYIRKKVILSYYFTFLLYVIYMQNMYSLIYFTEYLCLYT